MATNGDMGDNSLDEASGKGHSFFGTFSHFDAMFRLSIMTEIVELWIMLMTIKSVTEEFSRRALVNKFRLNFERVIF